MSAANNSPLIGDCLVEIICVCWVHIWPVCSVMPRKMVDPNTDSGDRTKFKHEFLFIVQGEGVWRKVSQ